MIYQGVIFAVQNYFIQTFRTVFYSKTNVTNPLL